MGIGIKKFNWLPAPSAWRQAEAWRAQRSKFAEKSISSGDAFNATFAKAAADQSKGLAKLASQAALKRIKAAAKVKFDEAAKVQLDKIV